MRRAFVVPAALLVLATLYLGIVSLTAPPTRQGIGVEEIEQPTLAGFEDAQSTFWPHVSLRPSFTERAPINVIVRGATVEELTSAMQERGWNETPVEATDTDPETYALGTPGSTATQIGWADATGSHRYAYVHNGTEGTWVRQRDQLHDGLYFGERFHLRLYESPIPGEWVLMQAHSEYYDWFALRHAVDGHAGAQLHVENDFFDAPFVQEIWRKHLDNAGAADADGWATVIELAILFPAGLIGAVRFDRFLQDHLTPADRRRLVNLKERVTWMHGLLFATILTLVLGVRLGGIALETSPLNLAPKQIALLLFPVVGLVLPLSSYLIATRIERRMDAGVVAASALAIAGLIDYAILGVDVLPITIVLHRFGLILALGLIASGAARRATRSSWFNGLGLSGLTLWVGLFAAPFLGWV